MLDEVATMQAPPMDPHAFWLEWRTQGVASWDRNGGGGGGSNGGSSGGGHGGEEGCPWTALRCSAPSA